MTASNPGGQQRTATGAEGGATSSSEPEAAGLERTIAGLLTLGTYASIVLLVTGLLVMAADGMAPLAGGPPFDVGRLVPDIVAVRPEGFLWLGMLVVIATPATRVVASLIGYGRRGERGMAIVAGLILVVIATSVALAKGLES